MPDNGDASIAGVAAAAAVPASVPRTSPPPPRGPRLGEELPVFCERCGYSLNGLPQVRCGACDVLHFACPECNHHQPINTLRPAFQRMLGRLRAIGLALSVFIKINYFFWPLFGFGAVGGEVAYSYNWNSATSGGTWEVARFDEEAGFVLFLFAAAYAAIGRMLLLRWGRGPFVGLSLAGLIVAAMVFGAMLWETQMRRYDPIGSPFSGGFAAYLFCAFAGAVIGASVVWGIWLALVHAFLPKRAAIALLEWQRAMSAPREAPDRTDAATSVTA